MERLFEITVVARLAGLFVMGLLLGGQLNRGIYRLAWNPRSIGPWSPPPSDAPRRDAWDCVPVIGWIFLSRESSVHGPGYWVRPLLIELATGVGLAWLYFYEVVSGALLPPGAAHDPLALHAAFLSHVVLIALMIVATFIDFDEQTIPDEISLPGTIAGLVFAGLLPASRPLVLVMGGFPFQRGRIVEPLHLASPGPWPVWLSGYWGLMWAMVAFLGWWLAVLPYTWTLRRGRVNAVRYAIASVRRRLSVSIVAQGLVGVGFIAATWGWGGSHWESLFSSLVGMAFGGGLIWAVRIVGTYALGQEAMGFGDVTLMAMIGSFIGWQGSLIVFFLAPFAAVLIAVTQWLLTRRKDIAFGPYLCLAALILVVRWRSIWTNYAEDMFSLGWFVPAMVLVCLGLMGGMLVMMRRIRERLASRFDPDTEAVSQPTDAADQGSPPSLEGAATVSTPAAEVNASGQPDSPPADEVQDIA